MFQSILTSILRATQSFKIPGGKVTLGTTLRTTVKSPPQRRVIKR